jgi:peptidoglycan/LPS O-acetylase OafA/YrhL
MPPALYFATFAYVPIFVAGGAAGWLHARHHAGARRAVRSPRAARALVVGLVAVTILWQRVLDDGRTLAYPLAFSMIAIVLGALVFWVVEHPEASICRTLRWRPLVTIGVLSYGIYVWHMVAGQAVARLLAVVLIEPHLETDWALALAFVLHIALSIGLAAMSHVWVERPFLRLRDRLPEHRARSVPVAGSRWTSTRP